MLGRPVVDNTYLQYNTLTAIAPHIYRLVQSTPTDQYYRHHIKTLYDPLPGCSHLRLNLLKGKLTSWSLQMFCMPSSQKMHQFQESGEFRDAIVALSCVLSDTGYLGWRCSHNWLRGTWWILASYFSDRLQLLQSWSVSSSNGCGRKFSDHVYGMWYGCDVLQILPQIRKRAPHLSISTQLSTCFEFIRPPHTGIPSTNCSRWL